LCFEKKREWVKKYDLQFETKGKYALHSQSVQQTCRTFVGCVEQTRKNKKIDKRRRYPWKEKKFMPILWPAQAMSISGNKVILPMGRGRKNLVFDKPDWLKEKAPSKIIWNSGYEWHITIEKPNKCKSDIVQEKPAAIDLGQIHLGAVVTETGESVIVSGREIRSLKRQQNMVIAKMQKRISKCRKASKLFKKLVRSKKRFLTSMRRRIRDVRHKATRQIIEFCKENNVTKISIGDPSGVQKKKCGKKHNQRMSQWEFGKDIQYITEKAKEYDIDVSKCSERGSSSTCPKCQHRQKVSGRNWECKSCGYKEHRDIVGAINILRNNIGFTVESLSTTYLQPLKNGSSRCSDTSQLAA
jgi:putative transposase